MSSFVREWPRESRQNGALPWALAACVAGALSVFLLMPGTIASKTQFALHGLCAQRPSHSLTIGGTVLPLDARMTGIYLGAVVAGAWIFASGRGRAVAIPPRPVVVTLAAFVALMAGDGFNSMLADLGAPHPYEPSNVARFVSGSMAGTALGVAVAFLFASSIWTHGHRGEAVVTRQKELLAPLGITLILGSLAWSGLPMLYAPFAVGLLLAAVAVFWMLGIVGLTLVTGRGWRSESYGELTAVAMVALVGAMVTIAALAAARSAAERMIQPPQLT